MYVDDLIVTGADTGEATLFKEQMMSKFKMSVLELIYGYNKLRQRRGGFASPVHALIGGIDPTFGFGPCPLRTTYKMRRSYPLGCNTRTG